MHDFDDKILRIFDQGDRVAVRIQNWNAVFVRELPIIGQHSVEEEIEFERAIHIRGRHGVCAIIVLVLVKLTITINIDVGPDFPTFHRLIASVLRTVTAIIVEFQTGDFCEFAHRPFFKTAVIAPVCDELARIGIKVQTFLTKLAVERDVMVIRNIIKILQRDVHNHVGNAGA